MNALTARQAEVMDFLRRFRGNNGYPPTRLDIARHFGWKSPNAAECHLRALEAKGEIFIDPGTARGITLAQPVVEPVTP